MDTGCGRPCLQYAKKLSAQLFEPRLCYAGAVWLYALNTVPIFYVCPMVMRQRQMESDERARSNITGVCMCGCDSLGCPYPAG